MITRNRPTGITILAVLEGIFGSIIVILGLWALSVGYDYYYYGIFQSLSAILIILGLASLSMSYGLYNGRGWAWTIAMIIQVIELILSLFTLPVGIVGVLINAIILYYLTRIHVKYFFGKVDFPEVPLPPPPPV